jgi:hypothetical protein
MSCFSGWAEAAAAAAAAAAQLLILQATTSLILGMSAGQGANPVLMSLDIVYARCTQRAPAPCRALRSPAACCHCLRCHPHPHAACTTADKCASTTADNMHPCTQCPLKCDVTQIAMQKLNSSGLTDCTVHEAAACILRHLQDARRLLLVFQGHPT